MLGFGFSGCFAAAGFGCLVRFGRIEGFRCGLMFLQMWVWLLWYGLRDGFGVGVFVCLVLVFELGWCNILFVLGFGFSGSFVFNSSCRAFSVIWLVVRVLVVLVFLCVGGLL